VIREKGFIKKLAVSAAVFAAFAYLIVFVARLASAYSEIGAGLILGSCLAILTSSISAFWKRQALAHQDGANLVKIAAYSSGLRLVCLVGIVLWGFWDSFVIGLVGILSFGLAFLAATLVEVKYIFKRPSSA